MHFVMPYFTITGSNSTVTAAAADTTTWLVASCYIMLHVQFLIFSDWSNRHSGTTSQ